MMDIPLTVTSIMRYGRPRSPIRRLSPAPGDATTRRRTYAALGGGHPASEGAARLGVDGDQRVATFMWNNAEHLEAYLAIPSMGAVMHTLNIRLSPDQVGYIATHAGDHAVIVDDSLVPLFAPVLQLAASVRHVIVSGPADPAAQRTLGEGGPAVHAYEEMLAASRHRSRGRISTSGPPRHVLHQRHDRVAERRGLQPPVDLPALPGGLPGQRIREVRTGEILPVVPSSTLTPGASRTRPARRG